ncbi:MAG: dihydrolipoamide acetyltransferase family protein [Candidatus Sericytochromatia bacterium]|nr:dihydrolipoamide acetyltransferase family protein [Candidatus Sericytochromatia bacterium]
MASNILMPKMGYDMEEGKLLRWLKQEGEPVNKGEPVAEIETDKVAIEIEAFASGVLAKILVGPGESAAVGAPIGVIGEPGEKVDTPSVQTAPPAPEPTAEPQGAPPPAMPKPSPSPAPPAVGSEQRIFASPLARRMASEQGIGLEQVQGSGPKGRIVKRDVETALEAASTRMGSMATSPEPLAMAPKVADASGRREPLSGMRRAIARRMSEAMAPIPHFYVTTAISMDAALALRTQINADLPKEDRISVNDLVVKACAVALRKHPSLNARWEEDAIFYPSEVAISVAVAIPDGLIAPDIHSADIKSLGAIGREIRDKATRAKSGQLSPDEYGRGTFTVSNLGMFGVEAFTAIVTPPQSAALAVGAVQPEAVVKEGALAVGQVMRVTVSADHRITDGAGSAQFAAEIKRLLENPLQLLI